MYDYRLDDAGISNFEDDSEEEDRIVNRASLCRFFKTIRCTFAFDLNPVVHTVGPVGQLDGICEECGDHPRDKLC